MGPIRRTVALGCALLFPAALRAQAPGLAPGATSLAPARDSFDVLVQGRSIGFSRREVRAVPGGFLYVEETQIGEFVRQRTEIALGHDGLVRQVQQGGVVQGVSIRASLAYRGGRVRGVTVAPSGGAAVTFTVDTAVAPDVVDDNAIPLYLPTLGWGTDTLWRFTAFVSGENAFRPMTLAVIGADTLTVPAGRFDVWLAELRGGQVPVRFFVNKTPPHRVVREEIIGTPLTFVLVR
ncbi:MAG TPA: hypothetical protein VFS28_04580 [Gemmatimonadales bacterium]|nr:hypothetical protein [Gemmatimonadales bacterium]